MGKPTVLPLLSIKGSLGLRFPMPCLELVDTILCEVMVGHLLMFSQGNSFTRTETPVLMQHKTTAIGKIMILIGIVMVIAVAVVGVLLATTIGSTTSTEHLGFTGSCYGLPGTCSAGYVFTLTVNYTGPWKVTYQGYNDLGKSNATTVSGNYGGSGSDSWNINVTGSSNGCTLCAQGQKLDASNFTLTISIGGAKNETSLPYGSTSTCQEMQYV